MRKTNTIFSLIITLVIIGVSTNSEAQRRGHQRSHDRNSNRSENRNRSDREDHKHHHHKDLHQNRKDHYHDKGQYGHHKREIKHHHHSHNHPVVTRHYGNPRYIYYRDYDVYYDCHRNVYISYAGRNWTISAAIPHPMRHVNLLTARSFHVDYYNDDFPSYLERRRPAYGREYSGW